MSPQRASAIGAPSRTDRRRVTNSIIVGHLETPIEVGTGASFLLKHEEVRIIEMTAKTVFKAAWIARPLGNWGPVPKIAFTLTTTRAPWGF